MLDPTLAAGRFGEKSLFCVAIWTGSAKESMTSRFEYLRALGCRHVTSYSALGWAHGRAEIPFHSFDLPSRLLAAGAEPLRDLAGSLADDKSRMVLTQVLRQRLLAEFSSEAPSADQYFVPGISEPGPAEVFVDGGAYTGDTLAEFVRRTHGSFQAYHAFEPDAKNLATLRATVAGLPAETRARMQVHGVGLYSSSGTIGFAADAGVSSAIAADGGGSISTLRLDDLGIPVSFLKLDIEGAEPEALKGAAKTLATHQPTAAVCVYHHPSDLWTIPGLIRQALPSHRLYLRQHGFDGWEIVLYAVRTSFTRSRGGEGVGGVSIRG